MLFKIVNSIEDVIQSGILFLGEPLVFTIKLNNPTSVAELRKNTIIKRPD